MKKLAITIFSAALLIFSAGSLTAQSNSTMKPVQLKPLPTEPISLHINEDAKSVYQTLGKMLGLTVSFDPDYQSKVVQVDFSDATPAQALEIVGELTGTFYTAVTPDTVLIAANTHQKHLDLERALDQYVHTFHLKGATQVVDQNEIVAAMRNVLSAEDKVYLVNSQDAIVVQAPSNSIALAQSILDEIDRPKKTYRLTFTATEMDGGKQINAQHYTMILVAGQETSLKLGNRVPIVTGSYSAGGSAPTPQYTYIDVGMNFDASLTEMGDNAMLKSDVEDSSVAPVRADISGTQQPIVRQATLKGESLLTPHKPVMLGSVDIPGSASHLDIEVVMEPLP